MTLYILTYNNYYNRLVKQESRIEDYLDSMVYELETTNFNPNDGITATHVIGVGEYDGTGDYLVVCNELNEIVSRWFIIESVRTRAGQYSLLLKRDLVVDYYNLIVKSPMFIEKATLPYESPFLFNDEEITVNQIKQREDLLIDRSRIPWLVGYYSKGAALEGTVSINTELEATPIGVQTIEDWEFYPYSNNPAVGPQSYGAYTFKYADGPVMSPSYFEIEVNSVNGNASRSTRVAQKIQLQHIGTLLLERDFTNAFVSYGLNKLDASAYTNTISEAKVQELLGFQGQIIKSLDGRYYKVTINSKQETETISIEAGVLFNALSAITKNMGFIGDPDTNTFKYKFTAQHYSIRLEEQTNLETKFNVTTNRLITTDAPWDIFAIPFGTLKIITETSAYFNANEEVAIALASAIQTQFPSVVHDIQVLPYCPVQSLLTANLNEVKINDSFECSYVTDKDNNKIGVIFNVPSSRFSFNIIDTIEEKFTPAQTNIEKKLRNECDKWRLTSPNYSNYFDFSIEKNGGIDYFNVDCEYKPFTPYIHVNPNFNYLYGYDDNSPRGLVLGGDFSISQIIDQWKQYQIQNKNFQNIFDRQIQNMEVTNKYQRIQDKATAITGTVSGAASGAFAGATMSGGNPYAAVAGGIVGGVASGIGGITDYQIKEKLRNEAMDYTKDLFGYNLGNIQALPNTISKVSALNNNNKIFPILEYYTCTDEELDAYLNKVAYNGMTTMVIGKMEDYIGNNSWEYRGITDKGYIKGQLIRFEDGYEDFHLVNSIAEELNKGVYIK